MVLAEGATGLSLTEAFTQVMTLATSAMNFISENPFLVVVFASCLAPVAFHVISSARHSVGA